MSKRRSLLAVLLAMLASACATGDLAYQWRDPQRVGEAPFARMLVMGIDPDEAFRNALEDSLASALHGGKVAATAGHRLWPRDGAADPATLQQRAGDAGFDSVLIVHLVGVRRYQAYGQPNRPGPGALHDDYAAVTRYVAEQAGSAAYSQVFLAASLYAVADGGERWMANSRVVASGERDRLLQDAVPRLADRLSDQGLLP